MKHRKWSHQDLADRTGIQRPQITTYLKGSTMPGLDKVGAIASALGIPICYGGDSSRIPTDIREALEECDDNQLDGVRSILRAMGKLGTKRAAK